MGKYLHAFANPFYRISFLEILLFFAAWGIWWSFFQIWLTSEEGFSGAQVGAIYSFNSAVSLALLFIYGSIQDRLVYSKKLLVFCAGVEVLIAPFFTQIYIPLLQTNFYLGAAAEAVFLTLGYLAAAPTFEALTERFSRRYAFQYGQARAWGSLGYAAAALAAGFLFPMNPVFVFWAGSAVALVLLLTLPFLRPERNAALRALRGEGGRRNM